MSSITDTRNADANRDPISGTPGAHPVGTGIGAVVGGKGVAEAIDPTREETFWRDTCHERQYVGRHARFDEYGPAYGYGVNAYGRYPGRSFADIEPDMSRDRNASRGASKLSWDRARHAARDAWTRVGGSV